MKEGSLEVEVRAILKEENRCPILFIGRYVNAFKRVYKGNITRIYTLDNVRTVLQEYDGIDEIRNHFLVLEGVGNLSGIGQNSLLKFIEESKLNLILLSYNDKVLSTILSRMRTVMKSWYPVKELKFLGMATANSVLKEKKQQGMKEYEEIQFLADNCPSLYSLKEQAGNSYDFMNRRLLDVITTKGGS